MAIFLPSSLAQVCFTCYTTTGCPGGNGGQIIRARCNFAYWDIQCCDDMWTTGSNAMTLAGDERTVGRLAMTA
jgi:hypothetical protein